MHISDILSRYKQTTKPTKVLYPRQEIIKKFVDRLNSSRTESNLKPLPASVYAIKMYQSGLEDDQDLNWFYGYCNDAKNFSSCWWWSLKPQKK